jgi:hypothetical protein
VTGSPGSAPLGARTQQEDTMNPAWKELFTTDVGLLSLGVIVGVLVIGSYLNAWALLPR